MLQGEGSQDMPSRQRKRFQVPRKAILLVSLGSYLGCYPYATKSHLIVMLDLGVLGWYHL